MVSKKDIKDKLNSYQQIIDQEIKKENPDQQLIDSVCARSDELYWVLDDIYENDFYEIPEDIKSMDDEQLQEEAKKACTIMEQNPVIHKKKPLDSVYFKFGSGMTYLEKLREIVNNNDNRGLLDWLGLFADWYDPAGWYDDNLLLRYLNDEYPDNN